MRASEPAITVMTVSRRPEQLSRCLRSVREQDYTGPVRHLLVVDDNDDCRSVALGEGMPENDIVVVPREAGDVDGPVRLAGLRNHVVTLAGHSWMAFIDDDNCWERNHLSSLWAAVEESGADLSHSERLIFESDGRPFLRDEFPWGRDEETRKAVYAYCVAAGVMVPGSNVMRDRMGMRFTWVDLGEWLFPPAFLTDNPFDTTYDAWDWYEISVEDRNLPRAVHTSGLRVATTGLPTLHYFMGGFTNSSEGASVYWREPPKDSSEIVS